MLDCLKSLDSIWQPRRHENLKNPKEIQKVLLLLFFRYLLVQWCSYTVIVLLILSKIMFLFLRDQLTTWYVVGRPVAFQLSELNLHSNLEEIQILPWSYKYYGLMSNTYIFCSAKNKNLAGIAENILYNKFFVFRLKLAQLLNIT